MQARNQGKRIIRRPAVEQKTGLSDSQRDALEACGRFPRRVPLGARAIGWVEDEVDEWVAQRIAARDDPEQAAIAYAARLPKVGAALIGGSDTPETKNVRRYGLVHDLLRRLRDAQPTHEVADRLADEATFEANNDDLGSVLVGRFCSMLDRDNHGLLLPVDCVERDFLVDLVAARQPANG